MEVTGSHIGLVYNRKAYAAIATALAAPELPVPTAKESHHADLI
jgi:hypothetical protein